MKYIAFIFLLLTTLNVSLAIAQTNTGNLTDNQRALLCTSDQARANPSQCCTGEARAVNQFVCTTIDINNQFQQQQTQQQLLCSKEKATTQYDMCCSGEARRVNQFVCTNVDIERNLHSQLPSGTPTPRPDLSQYPDRVVLPYADSNVGTCSKVKFNSILDILIWGRCIIGVIVIPLLFTIAFLVFVWGVISYMRNQDNEKKREESKRFLLWAILGLTVLTSVWGLVRIVTVTFGLGNTVPELQTDYLRSGN